MFLKITQSNDYQYVRIVRSYWKDGKSRQQVIINSKKNLHLIKGHFVVCFMAFVLERALENKLKDNKIEASSETIKESIQSLEVSEIQLRDERYYLKAKHLPLASKIFNVLRIKHLKNISPKEEIAAQFN